MNDSFRVGESVYFRSLSASDIENRYYEWFNDEVTSKNNSHSIFPETKEDATQFHKELKDNNSMVHFAIIDIETDMHIGCCSLQCIDWISRSAEMARIIGKKDFRGKGIGTEVGKMLLEYGFNTLNLNKIWVGNVATNEAAIGSKNKLGFTVDGVLREANFKNGTYHDVVISSILKREYTSF